jgi:hypothetical protein
MHSLNIVRMIVPPRSSHASGTDMIRHDVVVIGERRQADGARFVLLDDLAIKQLPHLRVGTELAVSSGMLWVFDTLHAQLSDPTLPKNCFSATAVQRAVNGT